MEKLVQLLDDFNRDLRPFEEESKFTLWDDHIELATYLITNDVKQVVHGRWRIETDEEQPHIAIRQVVCSMCNGRAHGRYNYCPNCGAKMDLEDEA